MFLPTDAVDRTKPFTKQVLIDGELRNVTVLPPGPESHDETVWSGAARSQHNPHKGREPFAYDGIGAMMEHLEVANPRNLNGERIAVATDGRLEKGD